MTRKVIGRVRPRIFVTHQSGNAYLMHDEIRSSVGWFIALKDVPKDVSLLDSNYWEMTFDPSKVQVLNFVSSNSVQTSGLAPLVAPPLVKFPDDKVRYAITAPTGLATPQFIGQMVSIPELSQLFIAKGNTSADWGQL